MAHLIETMAYAGETPWHGLGTPVHNDLTPDQMLEKAGLNWSVDKYPEFIEVKGKKIYTGKQALVRSSDNRVLTHISENWNEVQNSEAADFFYDFVMAGDMEMHTAGSIREGNMVWFLAKVKEQFKVGRKDVVESYLLFSLPHEYGKCLDIRFTPTRVVCNNTLTLALNGKTDMMVRLNHSRKFDAELVKQTLKLSSKKLEEYHEMADFLASRKISKAKVVEYFNNVFPLNENSKKAKADPKALSRPATVAMDVLETQPGADLAPGTYWNAFNAVTYSIDHLLGHSQETRLNSAWYGANRNRKIDALKTAVKMAEAA